ncbi:hypothetical protein [Pimelobacter simplex]|uniref:hypothetical protein n=1 Tax=Nocardioides simplex TaxID=2045 RepID=UPI001933440D|nr:hypothetical protein [Pimelobacter simplex]
MTWTTIEEELPLDAPAEQSRGKGHDPAFITASETFDSVRDACNGAIDWVNGVAEGVGLGRPIPSLPTTSLDQYVVYPLSGDYLRIKQNAEACRTFGTAMKTWGHNFGVLGLNQVLVIGGEVGVTMGAQLGLYDLAVQGMGGVVSKGSAVFDYVARISERIAIRVEKALVELGERLLRLSSKLLRWGRGYWGALMLAKDLAEKGIDAITEVIDDAKYVIEAINACFELKDAVEEWCRTQGERIKAFKEILDFVKALPSVDLGTPLGEAPAIDPVRIKEKIDDIVADFGADGGQAEEDLDAASDDLVEDSGYTEPYYDPDCDPSNNVPGASRPPGWTPENGAPGWMVTTTTDDDPLPTR